MQQAHPMTATDSIWLRQAWIFYIEQSNNSHPQQMKQDVTGTPAAIPFVTDNVQAFL